MSRFSEAISEGDGISVIPVLEGDVEALAALAEEAGAEGDRGSRGGRRARPRAARRSRSSRATATPPRSRTPAPTPSSSPYEDADRRRLGIERAAASSTSTSPSTCARRSSSRTCSSASIRRSSSSPSAASTTDEEDLELTLDLLADVPAGKLVVSEARIVSHDQVLALERAGVDAILVHGLPGDADFPGRSRGARPWPRGRVTQYDARAGGRSLGHSLRFD